MFRFLLETTRDWGVFLRVVFFLDFLRGILLNKKDFNNQGWETFRQAINFLAIFLLLTTTYSKENTTNLFGPQGKDSVGSHLFILSSL
ncbi:hypothetical protein [Cytobacillus purgationiresistens]|uniref:Uncharacterized protein n=1 Tax=Cytobacillus purgationiresistens TaxID=863449 RepID=A0ABU0ALG3_9BACI|nr:hypothetical protein [Cytobacillus purgationiresistens]MDQ0271729.1 hypothetical protein [Cytobacillus purgationiresistens]